MPQPLSKVRPNIRIDITPGAINRQPELAIEAMKVIAFWAHIEGNLAIILSAMLKADVATGVAMYEALSMGEGRRAAILAAAKHALPEERMMLFQALLNVTKGSRQQRNDFSHHVWGHSEDLPNSLLLMHPSVVTQFNVSYRQVRQVEGSNVIQPTMMDRSKIFVYREADMRRAVRDAANADLNHTFFYNAIQVAPASQREAGLRLLTSVPQIQRELRKLYAGSDRPVPPELNVAIEEEMRG